MDGMTPSSVDLIICDGPYGVTEHTWDKVSGIQTYNLELIKKFSRILKKRGSAYLFGKADCPAFIDCFASPNKYRKPVKQRFFYSLPNTNDTREIRGTSGLCGQ